MQVCKDGHREIVFNDMEIDDSGCFLWCPMCELLDTLADKDKDYEKSLNRKRR